jgi:hypothetical protein
MTDTAASDRRVIAVTGTAREPFLQGLVTNDLRRLAGGPVYAALLTPQGKYLADFLLVPAPDAILIDIRAGFADALVRRLTLYRLRADVAFADAAITVTRGTGPAPATATVAIWPDPRHPALGWRAYGTAAAADATDWDALRVAHVIPETGIELIPDDTYILEAGFERLNGVDFRKGCYVGQEVTARMKHKTELRKGLVRVGVTGPATEPGTPVLTADGRPAGTLFTRAGDTAIAHLRMDRAEGPMTAGGADVKLAPGA